MTKSEACEVWCLVLQLVSRLLFKHCLIPSPQVLYPLLWLSACIIFYECSKTMPTHPNVQAQLPTCLCSCCPLGWKVCSLHSGSRNTTHPSWPDQRHSFLSPKPFMSKLIFLLLVFSLLWFVPLLWLTSWSVWFHNLEHLHLLTPANSEPLLFTAMSWNVCILRLIYWSLIFNVMVIGGQTLEEMRSWDKAPMKRIGVAL